MFAVQMMMACSAPAPAPEVGEASQEHGDHDHGDAHATHGAAKEAPGLELSLDGEAKWQMDAHTREVMAETRSTVREATVASDAEVAALHAALKGQLDRLIEGCTMVGAAHDELHVFLMAWIPELDALAKADASGGAEIKGELEAMLVAYDAHFE